MQSPMQWYQQSLAQGYVADSGQQAAVAAMEQAFVRLGQGQGSRASLYLWGPVGRGKTWLMDHFYANAPVPAKRQHFHHFMRDLHQRLHRLTGTADPLQHVAAALAKEVRLLCFDELFVSDIADAMLLGPLFDALFQADICIVATSNQAPQQLYADGFNRERFLPAIAAMLRYMQVVAVDGGQDHRTRVCADEQRYFVRQPGEAGQFAALFQRLCGELPVAGTLMLNGRPLACNGWSDTVLWCSFAELCMQPRAAADYMALCERFSVLLLDDVPCLGGEQQAGRIARGTEDAAQRVVAGDRQLPALAALDDAVRRFIALIDECYECKVPAYIEACVPLERLYNRGYLLFPFQRTLSRIRAMQSRRF